MTDAPHPDDIFSDNHRWGDQTEWHQAALALHERSGIHRIERDGITPFWAVIDHAAVLEIERQPELFTNAPEPVLATQEAISARLLDIKTLIHMDAPEHNKYRAPHQRLVQTGQHPPAQRPPRRAEPRSARQAGGAGRDLRLRRSTSPCRIRCR